MKSDTTRMFLSVGFVSPSRVAMSPFRRVTNMTLERVDIRNALQKVAQNFGSKLDEDTSNAGIALTIAVDPQVVSFDMLRAALSLHLEAIGVPSVDLNSVLDQAQQHEWSLKSRDGDITRFEATLFLPMPGYAIDPIGRIQVEAPVDAESQDADTTTTTTTVEKTSIVSVDDLAFAMTLGLEVGADDDDEDKHQHHHFAWPYASYEGALCGSPRLWFHGGPVADLATSTNYGTLVDCDACVKKLRELRAKMPPVAVLVIAKLAKSVQLLTHVDLAAYEAFWLVDHPDEAKRLSEDPDTAAAYSYEDPWKPVREAMDAAMAFHASQFKGDPVKAVSLQASEEERLRALSGAMDPPTHNANAITIRILRDALRRTTDKLKEATDQLHAIEAINEDDWENGKAATWVHRIRNGETLEALVKDGMETQDALEERFCGSLAKDVEKEKS